MNPIKSPTAAAKRPGEALPGRRLVARLHALAVLAALAGLAGPTSAHEASPRPAMLIFAPAEAATTSGRDALKARIAVVAKAYCSANAVGPSPRNCRRAAAAQLLEGVDQSVEAYRKVHPQVAFAER